MSLNLAVTQRAQYFENDGTPVSQGRVTFYEVGSSTIEKAIYADPDGLTQLDSSLVLDIGGFVPVSGVFYEAGNYSVKVERRTNPEGVVPVYELAYMMPNVPGSLATGSLANASVAYVESVEAMANLTPNLYDYVYCFNYYTGNIDNGGGWFRWVSTSTAPTDLGMIFSLSASAAIGRMVRIYDENILTSFYGVTPNRGVNMSSRISQAATWAVSKSETLQFVSGRVQIDGTALVQNCAVQIDSGFSFDRLTAGVTSVLRLFDCDIRINQQTDTIAFDHDLTHYLQIAGDVNFKLNPAWYGAIGDNTADDYLAFKGLAESIGVVQIEKGYLIQGTGSGGSPSLEIDEVNLVDNGYINNSIVSIIINNCVSAPFANNNFRTPSGGLGNWTFNFVGHAQWFFDTTPTDEQLIDLRTHLTSKKLIWDLPTQYTFPSPQTGAVGVFENVISFGTTLKFTTNSNIGLISAGDYRIFSSDSSAPSITSMKTKASWFGLSPLNTDADNRVSLQNAIYSASYLSGIVECGGVRVGFDNSIVIPTSTNVTIKNLNGFINGSSVPFFTAVNSDVNIIDSQFEGLSSDADCNIKLSNCELIMSSSGQGVSILGETINIKNCTFGYSGGVGWTGTLSLGSLATKATTKSVVFNDNTVNGGRIELSTGYKSNSFSDNDIQDMQRVGLGTETQYFISVFGGSNTTLTDNTIKCIDTLTVVATNYILDFRGNAESVSSLVCCDNSLSVLIDGGVGQVWRGLLVLGYATDGHNAKVKDNIVDENIIDCAQTTRSVQQVIASSAVLNSSVPLIFPFSATTGGAFVTGTCDSATMLGTSVNMLGIDTTSVAASGGNATLNYSYRVAETGTHKANMTFSLQRTLNI